VKRFSWLCSQSQCVSDVYGLSCNSGYRLWLAKKS